MSSINQRLIKLEHGFPRKEPGLPDFVRIMQSEDETAAEREAAAACIEGTPTSEQMMLWEGWKRRVRHKIALEFPGWLEVD